MLIANVVLSHACNKRGDRAAAAHASEVARLADAGAAAWTGELVDALLGSQPGNEKRGQA